MANHSNEQTEPLLLNREDELTKASVLKSSAKWTLKLLMWIIFIAWASLIFFSPTDFVNQLAFNWFEVSQGTIFGITGSIFLMFSAPILVIAFLAVLYLIISAEEESHERKNSKPPQFRLWTFPVIVDGPFGVVSAGEMIAIIIVLAYIIWAIVVYTIKNYDLIQVYRAAGEEKSILALTGVRLGSMGVYCLAFLFIPVARGSILLRLVNIPFEHAVRYHIWLGNLTMFILSLHGLCFFTMWIMHRNLLHKLIVWEPEGNAHLPGFIALLTGLLMWVTSLSQVRRRFFELFYYTHQLYIVFIVCFALHVGDGIFNMAAAGIFIFMLDRFLRFCQSRKTVDVVSATCFPCGTLELVVSKPANLSYNALSWTFLQVRELSRLQWHPFSVSSSPLDGKYHMKFLIKVLGGWTSKLKDQIATLSDKGSETELLLKPGSNISVSVEGPYGHESPYYLEYENLILVAGGIGISPFLAILSDILHRLRDGKPCLPKNILIIWAIKTINELPLLQTVDMSSSFSDKVNLEIQTYVTRQSQPSLEEGKVENHLITSYVSPATKGRGVSVLVGTGSVVWSGLYLVVSTVGLMITVALLNIFYINPFNITYWWYKGLLYVGCMIISVVVFGGLVIALWHLWDMKTWVKDEQNEKLETVQQNDYDMYKTSGQEQYASSVLYGQRPDFGGILQSIAEQWGNVDIGVIVCGPPTLQTSVAKECRMQNFTRKSNQPIYHFNSHSFDL